MQPFTHIAVHLIEQLYIVKNSLRLAHQNASKSRYDSSLSFGLEPFRITTLPCSSNAFAHFAAVLI